MLIFCMPNLLWKGKDLRVISLVESRGFANVCGWQQAYRAAKHAWHATVGYLQLSLEMKHGPQRQGHARLVSLSFSVTGEG